MQIISFPAHYQSVYTNFDISSFSLISCTPKGAQLRFNCGPFASPFGLFQTHFGDKACVNKIQLADCQCLKSVAKIAYLRPGGLFVANIASREAENE